MQLFQQSNHQSLIISAGLTPNPGDQLSPKLRPIGSLDLLQVCPVPMHPHNPNNQFLILSPHATHAILQRDSVSHSRVRRRAEHVQQCIFHVPRKLAVDMLLKRAVVALTELVVYGTKFRVRRAGEDAADFVDIVDSAGRGGMVDGAGFVVHELMVDGSGVIMAVCAEDHRKQVQSFEGEISFHIFLKGPMVSRFVGGFDRVEVSVRSAQDDVIEEPFFRSGAFH